MSEWSRVSPEERERAALAATRQALSPSAERVEAIWAAMPFAMLVDATGGKLVLGGAERSGPSVEPSGSAHVAASGETMPKVAPLGTSAVLKAAVATGVLGIALGFGAGYWVGQSTDAPATVVGRSAVPVEVRVQPAKPDPVITGDAVPGPIGQSSAVVPSATTEVQRRSPAPPMASAAEPTFYEELSYLRRAQSALRDGNAALALGLMTELDEMQPQGALGVERGVTRVLALCELGRVDEASSSARLLLRRFPDSPYGARLQKTCIEFGEGERAK